MSLIGLGKIRVFFIESDYFEALFDYSNLIIDPLLYFFSFLITISHFLLYVPTMLVIGLHGWFLHPIAILLCDMIGIIHILRKHF